MHRIEETVERGMCIGCGACSAATNRAITVALGPTRLYEANLDNASESELRAGSRVCPFSDESPNEDVLGPSNSDPTLRPHHLLGPTSRTFAGRITDESSLARSSSGGMTTWFLHQLIASGHVDAVINVGRKASMDEELVDYSVGAASALTDRRKSQYYAVTMADVLEEVSASNKRFALVGVPCFIKAARALCVERPELAKRLTVFVALVCGHFKTQAFAESLAWQLGVAPESLAEVDFRVKVEGKPATDYDFGARSHDGTPWRTAPTKRLVGGHWGHSAFQPEACNFCDDVVGETADITFGDAWLPQFNKDFRGTNLVITRDARFDLIFDGGVASGEIDVVQLSVAEAVESQAGGFRHRRQGLAVRLADDIEAGLSVPRKRVDPDATAVSESRAHLLRVRREMAKESHIAFAHARREDDLSIYLDAMARWISAYRRAEGSFASRLLRKLQREWTNRRRQPQRSSLMHDEL